MRRNKPTHIKIIMPQIIAEITRRREETQNKDSQKEKTTPQEAKK